MARHPSIFHGDYRGENPVMAHLRAYSFTVLICFAIAILIWGLAGDEFLSTLAFSLSIGLATHTLTMIGIRLIGGDSIFKVWIVTIPLGVTTGILIGSWLTGEPTSRLLGGHNAIFSLVICLIATYVFYSYYSMNELRARVREQELSQAQSDKMLAETELRLLQSQIEPHFLFNTLSHVVSLIGDDPERAERMLRKLTLFLRASLKHSRGDHSTLRDEIDLLTDYLDIIAVRMGDRLTYELDVDDDVMSLSFPPLILQPIVENAIVHGIEPVEEGGSILVRARRENDELHIDVIDSGRGIDQSGEQGGLGLANVKERLWMVYGADAEITLADAAPHGLEVTLRIPLKEAAHA